MSEPTSTRRSDQARAGADHLPVVDAGQPYLPAEYRQFAANTRSDVAPSAPRVAHIEVTAGSDPAPALLSLANFASILGQLGDVRRAVLLAGAHGEPLRNPDLAQMIELLKLREVYVAVESSGEDLTRAQQEELAASGLDEFRLTLYGTRAETHARLAPGLRPGAESSLRVLSAWQAARRHQDAAGPRPVLRYVLTHENMDELPGLLRQAARLAVPDVYIARHVCPPAGNETTGDARAARGWPPGAPEEIARLEAVVSECEALAVEFGISLKAAGGRDLRNSLGALLNCGTAPWQACRRPWTSVYITVAGECLPCRIAPLAAPGAPRIVLGNLLRGRLAATWNGPACGAFRAALLAGDPGLPCAGCGVLWSL